MIQSIQYVSITKTAALSNTATINAVTTTRTAIIYLGQSSPNTAGIVDHVRFTLTNSTTVTMTGASTATLTGFCVVIEFKAAALNSNVQTGTIAVATTATSNTATVTSVSTTKSVIFYQGQDVFESDGRSLLRITQTNATTLTATRAGSGNTGTTTIEYTLVEFV